MPTYDQINALYQRYLGRAASQDEADNWANGTYGTTDLGGIEQQIRSSGEAQGYAQRQGSIPTGVVPPDARQGYDPPAAPASSSGDFFADNAPQPTYDQVNALYQQSLGRPASQDEYQGWIGGRYGATDLQGIGSQIANSGEAASYATSHGQLPPTNPGATFAGFDSSRLDSNTLKYNAMQVLQRFDPNNPNSAKQAFDILNKQSPGQYELDAQGNLMLTGTADGYIGARPVGWGSGGAWYDPGQGAYDWQWLAYNDAHQGPNGEGAGSGHLSGDGVTMTGQSDPTGGASSQSGTGSSNRYGAFASQPLGTGGGPGSLGNYGVPTLPYQSQPFSGSYQTPTLPSSLQQPYAPQAWSGGDFQAPAANPALQQPYAPRQWTGGDFVAPPLPDALRAVPKFANGVQDFNGGTAIVGEQGPEVVQLPPGSNVYPNSGGDMNYASDYNGPGMEGQPGAQPWNGGQQGYQPFSQGAQQTYPQNAGTNTGWQQAQIPSAQSSYYTPDLPQNLQQPFASPTAQDLYADPSYDVRLQADQQARQRSAAARGSILSGGTQLELGRAAQDYASNEYGNVYNRALSNRQQNVGEYQNSVGNALGARQENVNESQNQFSNALAGQQQNFGQYATQAGIDLAGRQQNQNEGSQSFNQALATYQTNYGQFMDANNLGLAARQQNQTEYQQNQVGPAQTAYQNNYSQYLADQQRQLNEYLTNYGINRTGVQDFLNQNNAVANRGLQATLGGRP